jgi:hypothetical protein
MAARDILAKFARNGAVIEGRGRMVAAAAGAILAAGLALAPAQAAGPLAGRDRLDVKKVEQIIAGQFERQKAMPDLPGMGILHGKPRMPQYAGFDRRDDPGQPMGAGPEMLKNHSGKGITIDYSGMVKDIQKQVDAEFPGKIHIVDRSRPAAAEAAKVSALTGSPMQPNEYFALGGDPHSSPGVGPKGAICIVVGAQPELDLRDMSAGFVEDMLGTKEPLAFNGGRGVDDVFYQRMMLWHEVGHCLSGGSEAKADVFAMLKMMAETRSRDGADYLIATREIMERVSMPSDDHIISPTLRAALDAHGNPEFWNKKRSLREMGTMADRMATPIDAHAVFVRNVLAVARLQPGHKFKLEDARLLTPVKEGFAVVDFPTWVRTARAIPEIGRIQELLDYLTGDPATRKAPAPFVADAKASQAAVAALAAAGDPTARVLAPALGLDEPSPNVPLASPATLPSHEEVGGKLIAFDRADVKVQFAQDLRAFLVRDAHSGKPLLSGDAARGTVKTFPALQRRAQTDSAAPAFGPRR